MREEVGGLRPELAAHGSGSGGGEASGGDASPNERSITKIPMKEAEEIRIPAWPSIQNLQIWKTRVTSAVIYGIGRQGLN